jgi:hypothetical protein
MFAELAMKRTPRSAELVTEAIRLARAREPHGEISGWGGRPAQRNSGAGDATYQLQQFKVTIA